MYINTIKASLASLVLYIMLKPWQTSLTNIAGYTLILSTIALPVIIIIQKQSHSPKTSLVELLVISFFSIVCISFFTSIEGQGIDIELVKSLLGLLCMYYVISCDPQEIKKKDISHIFIIYKILSLTFIIYTLFPFSFRYTLANEWGYYAFTLSMGNTNATSIQVFVCVVILGLEAQQYKTWWKKSINYVLIGLLFNTLYLLQCRTIMLCSIAYVLMMPFKRILVKKSWVIIAIIISIISVWIQMGIKEDTMEILGKGIVTGRDAIYIHRMQNILDNPYYYLFGQICQHRLNNYHNGPFSILLNTGIIGLILCLLIWKTTLDRCIEACNSQTKNLAVFALVLYLIHSSTEAAPMMGMFLYGTPVMVLFRIAIDNYVEYDNEKDNQKYKCISKCRYIRHEMNTKGR